MRLIEHLLGVKYLLLGRLQNRIEPTQNAHRQDYVGIFAALEEIAQNIVGDAPNERNDLVVGCLIHG